MSEREEALQRECDRLREQLRMVQHQLGGNSGLHFDQYVTVICGDQKWVGKVKYMAGLDYEHGCIKVQASADGTPVRMPS